MIKNMFQDFSRIFWFPMRLLPCIFKKWSMTQASGISSGGESPPPLYSLDKINSTQFKIYKKKVSTVVGLQKQVVLHL